MRNGTWTWCALAVALGSTLSAAQDAGPAPADAGVVGSADAGMVSSADAGMVSSADAGMASSADAGVASMVDAGATVDAGVTTPPSFWEANFHGTSVYASSMHYEVGFSLGQGGLLFADGVAPIPLNAVVLRERNGIISYLLTLVAGEALSGLAIASSAARIDNVRTTSSSSTRYNADGSRTKVVTSTTTATVTQLKTQKQVDRETEAANRSLETGLVGHTFTELAIYADLPAFSGGQPAGTGYELTIGGHGQLFELFELPVVLDVGFHLANVRVRTPAAPGLGGPLLFHSAGGVLARLRLPLSRFAALSVEWILNFLSFEYLFDEADLLAKGSRPLSPLRFTLDVFATDHVFLRGEATFGALGVADGRLGLSLTAGVRL